MNAFTPKQEIGHEKTWRAAAAAENVQRPVRRPGLQDVVGRVPSRGGTFGVRYRFTAVRRPTVWFAILLAVSQAAAQSTARPVAGKGAQANTLLVYANARRAYSLVDGLESLKLRLERVATHLDCVALSNAVPERIWGADYVVVYCPQICSELPKDFLRRIAGTNRPVLWVGFGADQLEQWVPFKEQFEVSPFAAGTAVTNVSYDGRDWDVTIDPWIPATLGTNSASAVLMSFQQQVHDRLITRPLCWKTAHVTFFAAEPSGGTVGFLFEDLLLDFYQATDIPTRRVFLRIEDYHCHCDHRGFRRMVDYLFARGHPFMVAVILAYRDPSTGEFLELDSQPEFADTLRYAQQRGGRLVVQGKTRTDQIESRDAREWWDAELDRPIASETARSLRERLQQDVRAMLRRGIFPLAWETPRYAASSAVYPEVARVFPTAVERVQLSDATGLAKSEIGGLTADRYGRLVVPENLGYVLDTPVHFVAAIKARAEVLTQLRGTVAGCFIHSYQPVEKLIALVETLEGFHVPFLDLADLDNRVEVPGALLLTGNSQRAIGFRNATIRWKAYDRAGHLLAETQEPTAASGERTFKRKGVGVYELIEFDEAP